MSIVLSPIRFIAAVVAAASITATSPPPARIVPYQQTYYGTIRTDPYHWMEAGGPEFDAYLRGQTEYATSLLERNPGRPKVVAALHDAYSAAATATTTSGIVRIGSRVFYMQSLPGSDDPSILLRVDGETASSIVVNASELPKGSVIGWFAPSPSGKRIAYGATQSSENVIVHVCDADGSADVAQAIDSSVIPYATWHGEDSFYYSSVRESTIDRTERSYLHVVGAPSGTDVQIAGFGAAGPLGSSTARDIYTTYRVLDGDAVVAMIQHDVTPHQAVYIAPFAQAKRAGDPWRKVFDFDDEIVAAAVGPTYAYGLTDRGDGHRSIIVRDRKTGTTVRTIAASGSAFRTNIFADRAGVYVAERLGAEMRLERFDLSGKALGTVALPPANVIASLDGDPQTDSFAVETASFDDPSRWYEIFGSRASVRVMSESPPPPRFFASVRYENAFAKSADGTNVPYTVFFREGTARDGMRPTLVVGYGAYGYDIEPPVPTYVAALNSLGIVVVLAHVRGGGEFGEPWHLAGKGPTKQHTIDDYVACARAAVASGWTSHAKLAGIGVSAGGITIGGAVTQHPDLFSVAISQVGFNDMVDLENMPNGPGNVPEFGSVKTRDGFRDLLAMSAYDHVVPANYPAMILTTGLKDQRTSPWQVAKMAARLQASTTSGNPILLRADDQGHGLVGDEASQIPEYADIYTFMLWQLGEPGFVTT